MDINLLNYSLKVESVKPRAIEVIAFISRKCQMYLCNLLLSSAFHLEEEETKVFVTAVA